MKIAAFILSVVSVVFMVFNASTDLSGQVAEIDRTAFFSRSEKINFEPTRCFTDCTHLMDPGTCEKEAVICTGCSFGHCTPSLCTCMQYGAPYIDDLKACLGITEFTHDTWANLTEEQRGQQCVTDILGPYMPKAD